MNPKSVLFISAALTAFVLAVLFGVVTRVTNSSTQAAAAAPTLPAAAEQNTATATLDQPADQPAATAQTPLSPDGAAALAATAINRQDVYSVESSSYQGRESFKVVFSSGDVVYIGLDKQVLARTKLQATVISAQATQTPAKNRKFSGSNGHPAGGDEGGGGHDD